MTATLVERDTPQWGNSAEPQYFDLPVAASTKVLAGTIGCVNAAGYVVPGATSTTLKAVGRIEETVDNSDGADGDKLVRVRRGVFPWANSATTDLIAISERFDVCYIVDNQTVAKTDGSSARSAAGIIIDVDAKGVWVALGKSSL